MSEKEKNIMVVKLVDGDIIIAYFEEQKDNMVKLLKPMQIFIAPDYSGIGLLPYIVYLKEEYIFIAKDKIMFSSSPSENILSSYLSEIGETVIEQPSKSLIL